MTVPFSQYLNIRRAWGPSFSPDGKQLSFLTNITGVPQVWTVGVTGGWPDQITFDSERVLQARFSPTSNELVFLRDIGGNENAQIFLVTGIRCIVAASRADLLRKEISGMAVDPFFRMTVEDVFSIKGRGTVVTGQIESGTLRVNDEIYIRRSTSSRRATVTGIEIFRKILDQAQAGDNVGVLLRDVTKQDVQHGDLLLGSDIEF